MLFPAVAVAFSVTIVLMAALRPFAVDTGLVDRPGGRKSHIGEVPIIGGAAMLIGLLFGLSLVPEVAASDSYLLAAAALLVFVGVLDDRFGLPTSVRFITQITAVLIMVYGGNLLMRHLGSPFGIGPLELGSAALPITVLITVSVVNAFNLIDGVDGLAGSIAIIGLSAVAIVGGLSAPTTVISLITIAAIVGYLVFNFPVRANRGIRCFMGDAGSTLIGFIVVWVGIGICQGEGQLASPVICLWFASLPIYDLFTCFVRRLLKKNSPFKPGRDHFHHTLKRGGLNIRQVVAVLVGLQLIYAIIGLSGHFAGIADVIMFAAWSVLGISQRLIIKKYALMARVQKRQKMAADRTGNYVRPGTF